MTPPIKGTPKKRTVTQNNGSLPDGVLGVVNLVNDINNIKSGLNDKIQEVDEKVGTSLSLVDSKMQEVTKTMSDIEDATVEVLTTLKENALKGDPGKDADPGEIVKAVLSQVPKIDEEKIITAVVSRVPIIDTKKLTKDILSKIPDNKASLKIIQESIEIDPLSVIDKIMALPEEQRSKLQFPQSSVTGLDQTIRAFNNQITARGYLHGGGISDITGLVTAGTNVTITGNGTKTSPYVINSSGSGGITGSGSATQIAYWSGTSAITGNNNLWWDNTNTRLGVGTNAPRTSLDLKTSVPNGGTLSIQNTASNGYSAADIYDDLSNKVAGFGVGGSTTGAPLKGNLYFGTNATADVVFLTNSTEAGRFLGSNQTLKLSTLATGLVKSTSGVLSNATAGTDYLASVSTDSTLTGNGLVATPLGFNLSNSNIWTALQTINITGIGATPTDGFLLQNTTSAISGTQQNSPSLHWSGQGFGTTAGTSQDVSFRLMVSPVQNTVPSGTWQLQSSINGGAYSNRVTVSSGGTMTVQGSFTTTGTTTLATALSGILKATSGVVSVASAGTDYQLPNSTSNVSAGPISSSTQTITHGLGHVPLMIRLNGISRFIANSSGLSQGISQGIFNSSGNHCVYITNQNTAATSPSTSATFAISIWGATGQATGIVGNVTSTSFDIVWTVGADASTASFIWEAQ